MLNPTQKNKPSSRNSSSLRNSVVAVLLCLVTAASIVFYFWAEKNEQEHAATYFYELKRGHLAVLAGEIAANVEVVGAISSLYDASETVERNEFHAFTASFLPRHSDIQALEWIPRVRDSERETYEKAARRDGLIDFQIASRRSQGDMGEDIQRAEYYPVFFVEPLEGNEAALGFNLGSNPTRLKALEKAHDTGALAASGRIKLIQETGAQFGFLIFAPIYRKSAPRNTIAERRESAAPMRATAISLLQVATL